MSEKGKQKRVSPFSDEATENAESSIFESEVEAEYDSDVVIESSKKPYLSQSALVGIRSMRPGIPKEADNRFSTAEQLNPACRAKPAIGGSVNRSTLVHQGFRIPLASQDLHPSREFQAPRFKIQAIPPFRAPFEFQPTLSRIEEDLPKFEEDHPIIDDHPKKEKPFKERKGFGKKKHSKRKAPEPSGSVKRQKRECTGSSEIDIVVKAKSPMEVGWPISPVFSSTPPEENQPIRNLRVKEKYKSMAELDTTDDDLESITNKDKELETKKVRVWVMYEIWQEKEPKEKRAPSTSKRAQSQRSEPGYKKVTSMIKGSDPIHSFIIDPFRSSPEEFKTLGMIEVDHYVQDLSLYLTDPDPPKALSWIVTQRTSTRAGRFYNINNKEEWSSFIQIIQDLPPTHYVHLLLKMQDPSRLQQARREMEAQEASVKAFKIKKMGRLASRSRDGTELPVPGSANERSSLIDQIIFHHRKGDNSICYDPLNSNNYFRVTSEKARMWADIMIEGRRCGRSGVSLQVPPKTIAFRFHPNGISPLDQVRRSKESETQPSFVPSVAPIAAAEAPIPTATPSQLEPMSISDTDERLFMSSYCRTFEDFLSFARIKPGDKETRNKLENQAFDHWTDLRANEEEGFGLDTLIREGFPPATARKLISGAQRFGIRVRESIKNGFFRPIQL
ncbi:hypothetical protein DFH28DRAFT_1130144 [Melampsora americana]|nr:hypothetical protein DFH28DRAFT_1130144 [Melampsora americana]